MVSEGVKRVSKDDLRDMINFGKYSPENEMFILDVRNAIITRAATKGFDVVIDDCNLNPVHLESLENLASILGSHVEVIDMDTSLDECIIRDLERENSVGDGVIRSMHDMYLADEL
jgi:predicted kinase